jgi:hypothetical protein
MSRALSLTLTCDACGLAEVKTGTGDALTPNRRTRVVRLLRPLARIGAIHDRHHHHRP